MYRATSIPLETHSSHGKSFRDSSLNTVAPHRSFTETNHRQRFISREVVDDVFADSQTQVARHRMSFFAVESSMEVDFKRKRRFVNFQQFIEKIRRDRGTKGRSKKPRSMWEHTLLGKHTARITCPNCLYYVETDVRHYSNCVTHLIATSLLPVCMCALPYYSIMFKDTVHRCPRCMIFLGIKFSRGKNTISRWIGLKHFID